jgi:type II secretory pathway pseudopilin PulG
LVELMVAAVLLSVVTTAIFYLFQTTSRSMEMTDSRSRLLQRARMAVSVVSSDLRAAGAFASPDSSIDPKVKPKPNGLRVVGLASYNNGPGGDLSSDPHWQDNVAPLPTSGSPSIRARNPMSSFDGIVIMHHKHVPFEVTTTASSYSGSKVKQLEIEKSERGLGDLIWPNMMTTETVSQRGLSYSSFSSRVKQIEESLKKSANVIRVMDREGFYQFGSVTGSSLTGAGPLKLNFGTSSGYFQAKSNSNARGLAPSKGKASDIGYQAAAVASMWYFVERDSANPANYILKKGVGDTAAMASAIDGSGFSGLDPSANLKGATAIPLVENVVDFQLWFDCAGTSDKSLDSVSWQQTWEPPDGSTDPDHDCLDPSPSPTSTDLGELRSAHIRLSLRADTESPDLEHQKYPLNGPDGLSTKHPMKTFDIDPQSEGSAPVVTVQADVELTNFSLRALNL